MRKYVTGKGVFWKGTFFASVALLMAWTFHACQQDEVFLNTHELSDAGAVVMNSGLNPEIFLDYPEEVNAGEDFDITFSSTCGRIMIERGYVEEVESDGVTISKVYTGLSCDTENLMWEAVGYDVYESCPGKTKTENLANPGTYVYRAKLNFKAARGSGCSDCAAFVGNKVECFTITVVAGNQNEGTFTDERDGHEYKWVKIGNQIWMAENLAYQTSTGSYAYGNDENNVATYGRLYTLEAAQSACPVGWRLPSEADWEALKTYLSTNNGYGCEQSAWIARALAVPDAWTYSLTPGAPGYPSCTANTSGFSALPAGYAQYTLSDGVIYRSLGGHTYWWSSTDANPYGLYPTAQTLYKLSISGLHAASIRCIKNSD
jgi:uncharacterized protein (TIGR02145 family)